MKKNKFYRKSHFFILAIFIALLILPIESLPISLAFFQNGSPPQCSSKKQATVEQEANKQMNQTKLVSVPESTWGANGIRLAVEETAVKIEYDCADGEIEQSLKVDEQGNFTANGVHIRQKGGPIREDSPPPRQPARYQGKISGDKMTLKVTLTENGEVIGTFTLERGKTPRMHRCY
jgi:hypothetical protein